MVYLPPPQFETPQRPGYESAYLNILATHRKSTRSSSSSLIILVAPDVDALSAARMLADLLKQDDILYRIIPVSGMNGLEEVRDELLANNELRTLIMINMGSILDLPSEEWFGSFPDYVRVHVIDSNRPQNLASLFGSDQKIVVWDDGGAEGLEAEKKAFEALAYSGGSDSEDDSDGEDEDDEDEEDGFSEDPEDDFEEGSSTGKRRRSSPSHQLSSSKKPKRHENRPGRLSGEEREEHTAVIEKYYMAGTYYGQSASSTIYILANVLTRADNDLLWFAILGLTYQYSSSRISREKYDQYCSIYENEARRLNTDTSAGSAKGPDDNSIRLDEDLRFMLWRHWNLYDSMLHSSYVASKLGIWKERGRKRLHGLLAKMGFSTVQSQQPYSHMDMSLKKDLRDKLEAITPEYGMIELSYSSFLRCCGYRCQPLSAADSVEAVSVLLDVAGGIKLEVEVDGARNGGEWFGSGQVWQVKQKNGRKKDDERENIPPGGTVPIGKAPDEEELETKKELAWWVKNFWSAFDALNDIMQLREALRLSMTLHRAIVRQGSIIIDRQDIRTMRGHRVVILQQGPDLELFSHPGALSRLALWLVEAMRDRVAGTVPAGARSKKKSLPFVVACRNEKNGSYLVVGVTAALDFGDTRKNEFGLAFLDAKERCNARTRHGSFDTNVLEVKEEDLTLFLQTLCEGRR